MSVTATPRNAKRTHVRARRIRQRNLVILCCLLGTLLLAALLTTPLLEIKRVQARGVAGLLPEEAAAIQKALRLPPKTNLIRAPVTTLRENLNRMAWVRKTVVSRRFPNTLEARITPRQPVLVVATATGRFETDAEGVAIRPARAETEARLPLIQLPDMTARTGQTLDHMALNAALETVRADEKTHALKIVKIEVDQKDNLCLNMQDGIQVQLGPPDEMPAKIALLQRIYTREPGIARRLTAINLSSPAWPACTPRVPSSSIPNS